MKGITVIARAQNTPAQWRKSRRRFPRSPRTAEINANPITGFRHEFKEYGSRTPPAGSTTKITANETKNPVAALKIIKPSVSRHTLPSLDQ
jgi:hypothetical protein